MKYKTLPQVNRSSFYSSLSFDTLFFFIISNSGRSRICFVVFVLNHKQRRLFMRYSIPYICFGVMQRFSSAIQSLRHRPVYTFFASSLRLLQKKYIYNNTHLRIIFFAFQKKKITKNPHIFGAKIEEEKSF